MAILKLYHHYIIFGMWNATALCHVITIVSTENTYRFKLPGEVPAEQVKRQRRVVGIGKQKQQYPEYLVLNSGTGTPACSFLSLLSYHW